MKRLAALVVAALVALLALAGPASAHVTVSSTDATQGGYAVVTFRVPTESATASTTKLVVQLPSDTPFASVGVQPLPGWTETSATTKLAKPITTDDGDQITEAVSQVTWTAQSGGIKPGQFEQFNVQVGPLPKQPSVTFRAVQTYSDGTVVKWIEQAAPGSTVEPEHPAPVLTLAAANPSAAATKASKPAAASSSDNTGPVILSIIALVVAAAALGLALVTRARSRT